MIFITCFWNNCVVVFWYLKSAINLKKHKIMIKGDAFNLKKMSLITGQFLGSNPT